MSVATPQHIAPSGERRRHVRQRAFSLVCVKLGNDNGGILLNLGTGGLSFQVVAKLNWNQNLVLCLKLPDSGETIQIKGNVAWLGPTGKEAGICFRDLPDRTRQSISEWIARQGTPFAATELKIAPGANSSPTTAKIPLLPPRIDNQLNTFQAEIMAPQQNPLTALASDSAWGDILPDSDTGEPSAPLAAMSFPTPDATPPIYSDEHPATSIVDPNELSREPLQTIFKSKLPGPLGLFKKFPRTEGALLALPKLLSSTDAVSADEWIPAVQISSPPERKRRRQRLVAAGLASCVGILVLVVLSTNHRSTAPLPNLSPPTAVAPGRPVAGSMLQSQQRTMSAPSPRPDSVNTQGPIASPHKIGQQAAGAWWMARLKKFFQGGDNKAASDQALGGVQVWTHVRSGYYYCPDSPYFEKMRPGSLMTQRSALQSGYQPKLGGYCH